MIFEKEELDHRGSTKDHFDDWPLRTTFDVCCLKMTALSCNIYHIFLKALVYEEDHHARLNQRLAKKNTFYFKWGISVKWFVNFVCYWEKLMHTWITGQVFKWILLIIQLMLPTTFIYRDHGDVRAFYKNFVNCFIFVIFRNIRDIIKSPIIIITKS